MRMWYQPPTGTEAYWFKGQTKVLKCAGCSHHRFFHTDEYGKPVPCFEEKGCNCKQYLPRGASCLLTQ